MRDLPLLRRAGKTIAVTFQGDDARQGDVLRSRYAHSLADAQTHNYEGRSDHLKRKVIAKFDRYADLIYYLNPDLARVLPSRARFLGYASVDPRSWHPVTVADRGLPTVVAHAPSDRLVKGTAIIIDAVERLRADGVTFDFRLVEGVSQQEARHVYEQVDVLVEQLHAGWYGAAAVELMALGKTVMSFIREEDLGAIPPEMSAELPIVRTTSATLATDLAEVLSEPWDVRARRGAVSRAYVERWHDPLRIAALTATDYQRAAAERSRGRR
jgi:hypothetical protein